MKNKVRIIDTLSYSTFHEMFNSSVVAMCTIIFDSVDLRCSGSSWQNISKLILRNNNNVGSIENISQKSIKVIQRDDAVGGFVKYLMSGWINFWQLLVAPRNEQVIYTNNNPLSLWWVVILNMILGKDVAIFCHGELDLLIRNPKPWKPSFYYKYIFKLLFRYGRIGRHTKMFVLGDSILTNLQPFLNIANKKQFYSIEHPYFFTDRQIKQKKIDKPIKIGTVGAMTYAKGLQTLLDLSQTIDSKEIKLSVVGRVMEPIDINQYPSIKFLGKQGDYIEREDYEQAIENLDYILFLYPSDSYGFIASGAIFDAVDLAKPIIAIENDYFSHTLKLPIGYTAQNKEQISSIIDMVTQHPSEEDYAKFLDNIEQLKTYFVVPTVASDFKIKLNK